MESGFSAPQDTRPEGLRRQEQVLLGLGLADRLDDFRSYCNIIARDPQNPSLRDLTLATVALFLGMGRVGGPVISKTLSHLQHLSDQDLHSGAVAIVNGGHLLLPTVEDGPVLTFDISTLEPREEGPPPALTSAVYSLTNIWDKIEQILDLGV